MLSVIFPHHLRYVLCGKDFYAVFLQDHFVVSGIIAVTGKTIHFPNDNSVKYAAITVFDHLLKVQTVICFCRQCAVDIFTYNRDTILLGKLTTLAELPFNTFFPLVVRTKGRK